MSTFLTVLLAEMPFFFFEVGGIQMRAGDLTAVALGSSLALPLGRRAACGVALIQTLSGGRCSGYGFEAGACVTVVAPP